MCRYLDNDVVLGNLFLKVIERDLEEITFNKIYDFIYYTSAKLNENEETILLVSREGIMNFVEIYAEFVEVDEDTDTIKIIKSAESAECFNKRYRENCEEYIKAFDFAINQVAA